MLRQAFAVLAPCTVVLFGCGEHVRTGPILHLPESERDIGEIPVDPIRPYLVRLNFENRGGEPLNVLKVETSCGCMRPKISRNPVGSQERAELCVEIRRSAPEERQGAITLLTNDPQRPVARVLLAWKSRGEYVFNPGSLDLGDVLTEEIAERDVTVAKYVESIGDDLKFGELHSNLPGLRAEWVGPPSRDGRNRSSRAIRVRIDAGLDVGDFHGRIELVRSGTSQKVARFPVRWRVRRQIEVTPSQVFLGSGNAGDRHSRNLIVSAIGDGVRLKISEVILEPSEPEIDITRKPLNDTATMLRLEGRLPVQIGMHRWNLRIICREPVSTTLTVPISAFTESVR